MFANAVLDDLAYFNTYKVINVLQKERNQLKGNIGSLGEFGQGASSVSSNSSTRRFKRVAFSCSAASTRSTKNYSITMRRRRRFPSISTKRNRNASARSSRIARLTSPGPQKGTTLLIVSDDFTPWPFEGEYWLDEVTNYRSRLRSECVEQ